MNIGQIIDEAKALCFIWPFVPLEHITYDPNFKGACWTTSGDVASIRANIDLGIDVIAHEIFHSTFHRSPLHRTNECWGDGFCNAFGQFMLWDKQPPPYSPARTKCDVSYALNYLIPQRLIMEQCQYNYEEFKWLWRRWNSGFGLISLSSEMGFRPGFGYVKLLRRERLTMLNRNQIDVT